ncbi:MAG: low temperature requirement protein A [Myxococcota bacterium]
MRSRWFHRPVLHSPAPGSEKQATWLELFYDLTFVIAFVQLGDALGGQVGNVASFAEGFLALWMAWSGFTFFENRFTVDDFTHRLLVLAQTFAVGGMAIHAPDMMKGDTAAFSIATGAALGVVALMYARTWRLAGAAQDYCLYWGSIFAGASAAWCTSGFLAAPYCHYVWLIAIGTILTAPLVPRSRQLTDRYPLDFSHLGERYGLLTIIVLAASFVKLVGELIETGTDVYVRAGSVLIVTWSIWWIYFDDVAGARIRSGRGRWIVWLYSHIPLQMALTAVGGALATTSTLSWDEPAPTASRWLLCGSLAAVYFAVASIDSVTERKQVELSDRVRVNIRIVSGAALLVLAPAGDGMSGAVFLGLVTGLNALQVVIDMILAPFQESDGDEVQGRLTSDLARESREAGRVAAAPRRDISEAVRKGTPAELRRDLYFYFMEGSWFRVFIGFALIFVFVNLIFAGLLMLEPGAVEGASPRSFADAFFFSVHTISTIGYGTMSPGTTYGDLIVTLEAAVGMIGVAIVTGLVFSKASRPKASVLFSRCAVLTTMNGRRTLSFRVGNARGNEVVDASMAVTVIKDELSPEGHHFRRIHDLKLKRDRQPMFVLSWAVFHEIDEESPLCDVNWEDPEESLMGIIITLTGHDGTYGQTIYARHMYYAEDLRVGHRFVDVISQLDDGRLMIDYTKFHDTLSDNDARAQQEE